MRVRRRFGAVVVGGVLVASSIAVGSFASAPGDAQVTSSETLRILVTNDDGVTAPGLARVVDALQALPDVEVTVIAPATQQSGTGDQFTGTSITAAPATTANGDPATSVTGFPANSVLYGVLAALPEPPHVVVSGSNEGQNLGNITPASGTVGAARWANRLGLPAIALSSGGGTRINVSYGQAAGFAAGWLTAFRDAYVDGTMEPETLNVNVPTCLAGTNIRGFLAIPLGRSSQVGSYTLSSGTIGNGTLTANLVTKNPLMNNIDCSSTATGFDNDIDAFNNGFVSVTLLRPDLDG